MIDRTIIHTIVTGKTETVTGNCVYQLNSLEASVKAGDAIAGAMKEWMDKSCVEFVPRSNERAYLLIVNNDREM